MTGALLFAGLAFVSTMAGGLTALRLTQRSEWLMALAGGVVLAAALLDLLPEAVSQAREHGISERVPIGAVLLGYLAFHALERWAHDHHHHDDEPSAMGTAGATAFTVHSFFDGLAIGLGFRIDTTLGVVVALAVIGHDFFDGVNTVTFLRGHRHGPRASRRWLLADALAPVVGALIGVSVRPPDAVFPLALGFFSGLFVYVAATNLLPRARDLPATRALPVTLLGAALMFAITRAA